MAAPVNLVVDSMLSASPGLPLPLPPALLGASVVLVINSVKHPRFLGTVNGVSQTLMMSFEAIAPAAGGSIYAWSIGKGQRFPTDFHFFWILWFILCCVMFLLSLCLSQHINYRKFETNDPEEELEDDELLN